MNVLFKRIYSRLQEAVASAFVVGSLLAATGACAKEVYKVVNLGTLNFDSSFTEGINNRGQVVGYIASVTDGKLVARPFLWSRDGGMKDLGTFGGPVGVAFGVNDFGQVVGVSDTGSNDSHHAFLWVRAFGMRDLGTFGGLTRFMRRGASAFSDARFVSSVGCVRACRVWPLVGGGWCVILLGVGGIG